MLGALLGGFTGALVGPLAAQEAIEILSPGPFQPIELYLASLPIVAIGVVAGAWIADRSGGK